MHTHTEEKNKIIWHILAQSQLTTTNKKLLGSLYFILIIEPYWLFCKNNLYGLIATVSINDGRQSLLSVSTLLEIMLSIIKGIPQHLIKKGQIFLPQKRKAHWIEKSL